MILSLSINLRTQYYIYISKEKIIEIITHLLLLLFLDYLLRKKSKTKYIIYVCC
jgi:hypothetical protein